jgi:hypothetical protein
MLTGTVIAPVGDLCAGLPHLFTSEGCEGADFVQWVSTTRPDGVSEADIIYSSPNALETYITLPIDGDYAFSIECGVIV